MSAPLHLAAPARRPLHGTVIVDAPSTRPKAVTAHGEPRGTQGHALGIDLDGGARGCRVLPPARVQGDDRRNGFGLEKVIDALGVEATVVDDGAHRDGQRVGGAGLEEAV